MKKAIWKKSSELDFVEKSLELLVSKEITSVAICQNSADKEIIDSLVLNGFGIRSSDAMMEG